MLEFFGYIVLFLTFVFTVVIIYNTQNYSHGFIFFWIGVTVASMLILHFKKV